MAVQIKELALAGIISSPSIFRHVSSNCELVHIHRFLYEMYKKYISFVWYWQIFSNFNPFVYSSWLGTCCTCVFWYIFVYILSHHRQCVLKFLIKKRSLSSFFSSDRERGKPKDWACLNNSTCCWTVLKHQLPHTTPHQLGLGIFRWTGYLDHNESWLKSYFLLSWTLPWHWNSDVSRRTEAGICNISCLSSWNYSGRKTQYTEHSTLSHLDTFPMASPDMYPQSPWSAFCQSKPCMSR